MSKTARTIILRADGSNELGLGHVFRGMAIARYCRGKGMSPVFVVKNYDGNIVSLLRKADIPVEVIPATADADRDAVLTLEYAAKNNAQVIFSDLSNKIYLSRLDDYSRFSRILKKNIGFLVVFDGFGGECASSRVSIFSDITVIPYVGAENGRYKPNHGIYCLGPAYFIFNRQFSRSAARIKRIKKTARNILVSAGGSDPFNITIKIVNALRELNNCGLNLRVVIGPGFNAAIRRDVETILSGFRANWELLSDVKDMARLMQWADLAIITSGLTKYEAAVTGTPAIIITQDDSHNEAMREFDKAGIAMHLANGGNKVGAEDITNAARRFLSDFKIRKQFSVRAKRSLDGKGIERIFQKIPRGMLYAR